MDMNVQGCFSAATLLKYLQGQPPTAHIYFKNITALRLGSAASERGISSEK